MTDPRVPSDAAWSGALNEAGRPRVRHQEAPLGERLHPRNLQTSVCTAAGAVLRLPRAFSKRLFPRLTWGDTDSLLKHTATSFSLQTFTQRREMGTDLWWESLQRLTQRWASRPLWPQGPGR